MPKHAALLFRTAALAAALAVAACNQGDELAKIDNQIVGNDVDPALTAALEDQIMVDPALTQQSNKNAVRPPETPTQAQYPLPDEPGKAAADKRAGAGAQANGGGQGAETGGSGCGPELNHNMQWARRLPAGFAVYPGSRITDAAGTDRGDCRARVVTFTTADAPQRVLDHYTGRAASAGYSAEHRRREDHHILAGTNGGAGAFYLIVTPTRGGSDVALIVNGG